MTRLKLRVSELLEGGDDKKEERLKKKLQQQKKKSNVSKSNSVMIGPSMFDDDDDDWGFSSGGGGFGKMKSKFFKTYINKYTITIDMKLIEELPRDGCSLFQTALVHVKDDKRSGTHLCP